MEMMGREREPQNDDAELSGVSVYMLCVFVCESAHSCAYMHAQIWVLGTHRYNVRESQANRVWQAAASPGTCSRQGSITVN